MFLLPAVAAFAHGGEIDAVVEVMSIDGGFEYGIGIHWSDGDPVTGAHIVMRADQEDLEEVTEPVEVSPGVYVEKLPLTSAGEWRVFVAIHHPDSNGNIEFVQTVTGSGDGSSVVLVDTADEERVGSTPDPATALLDPHPPPSTTTTTAEAADTSAAEDTAAEPTTTTAAPNQIEATDVVVDIAADEQGPAFDVGLRVVHLVAIGMWIVPVFASVFGRKNRRLVVVTVAGVVLTLATGALLMLWGAPVGSPGLFSWSEIFDLSYGSSYLIAFVVKLVGVLLAAVATVRWAAASDRKAAWVTLGGATVAVAAVTAMSQFHLLSHF
jgi:hypothetical protein